MATQTQMQRNQHQAHDRRSLPGSAVHEAMPEFEFVVSDLRPLLTEDECGELEALERRRALVGEDRVRMLMLQRDVRAFVQRILAASV